MTNANDLINETRYKLEENAEIAYPNHGLTKREYFAAMAMQGILANHNTAHQIKNAYGSVSADESNQVVSNTAKFLADALINALNQSK